MSDLFLGEILVLIVLLPVLFRPLIIKLQRIEGIALLPLLSLLLCFAIIAGNGLRISFLPVFLFVLLVFLSSLSRLIRLFMKLPTDWFSPLAVVYFCFLLILFCVVSFSSYLYNSEIQYKSAVLMQRTKFIKKISPGVYSSITIVNPVDAPNVIKARPIVIMFNDVAVGSGSRNTLACVLVENGYTVIEADFKARFEYQNYFMNFPTFRKVITLTEKIFNIDFFLSNTDEITANQIKDIQRLVEYVQKEFGKTSPLYAIAEGTSCNALLSLVALQPAMFKGSVCVIPEKDLNKYVSNGDNSVIVSADTGLMPVNAGLFSILFLSGNETSLFGYGELAADDVLAAALLGVKRDIGRKNAEVASRRISTWLSLRSQYDNN